MADNWFRPRDGEEGTGATVNSWAGVAAAAVFVVLTIIVINVLVRAPHWFGWSLVATMIVGEVYFAASLLGFLWLVKRKGGARPD
jgi:hypothetical protein